MTGTDTKSGVMGRVNLLYISMCTDIGYNLSLCAQKALDITVTGCALSSNLCHRLLRS